MKLKFALIAATLALTGCVQPYGDVVSMSEVGQVRQAADARVYQGDLEFHSGTGIVYKRANNQCGSNCGKYAELEMKMAREEAARLEAGNADYERARAREKIAYKRAAIAQKCEMGMNLRLAQAEQEYHESMLTKGFNSKATQAAGSKMVKLRKTSHKITNQCIKDGLKNESN